MLARLLVFDPLALVPATLLLLIVALLLFFRVPQVLIDAVFENFSPKVSRELFVGEA